MSNTHLRSIERGVTDPSLVTIDRIAAALGTDAPKLVKEAFDDESVARTDL